MMQKYKKKSLRLKKEDFFLRLKRQRKNVTRRKKVSLFRLKTLGFGFFWTCSLLKEHKIRFLKKKVNFFFYKAEQPKPDVYFKNVCKVSSEASSAFFSFFNFFSCWDNALSLQHFFIFNKVLSKNFFFFKLFFFKLFFFKLFFFKAYLQHFLYI